MLTLCRHKRNYQYKQTAMQSKRLRNTFYYSSICKSSCKFKKGQGETHKVFVFSIVIMHRAVSPRAISTVPECTCTTPAAVYVQKSYIVEEGTTLALQKFLCSAASAIVAQHLSDFHSSCKRHQQQQQHQAKRDKGCK